MSINYYSDHIWSATFRSMIFFYSGPRVLQVGSLKYEAWYAESIDSDNRSFHAASFQRREKMRLVY